MTNSGGLYTFDNLPEGTYEVTVDVTTLPANVYQSYDADWITTTPNSSTHTLTPVLNADDITVDVEDNTDQDFWYAPIEMWSIGDYVWHDSNGDGVQDTWESGLPMVTLNLLDNNGDPIYVVMNGTIPEVVPSGTTWAIPYTTQTDSNGWYIFEELPAWTYQVQVDTSTLPADMYQTYDADGTTAASSHISEYTLDPIENADGVQTWVEDNDTQDFWYNDTGLWSLGNYVWQDYNEDGVQDTGEPGLENITLSLLDGNGDPIYVNTNGDVVPSTTTWAVAYTTQTDVNGLYLFENLPSWDYQVTVDASTIPTDMYQTSDYDDQATTNPTTPHTSSYTLTDVLNADGEIEWVNDNGDQDFGYNLPSGSIGDTIWFDTNADGIQDASELTTPPTIVNGLTVTLLDGTGNPIDSDPNTAGIQSTTTNN